MATSNQYWLVGTMFGGTDDHLEEFRLRNYWYCWDKNTSHNAATGHNGNSFENQQERFLRIRIGDRIAAKKVISIPNQEMQVRALGIVKDIDVKEWRVYVKWLPILDSNCPSRIVDLKGCTASLHGPYQLNNAWIQEIFCT